MTSFWVSGYIPVQLSRFNRVTVAIVLALSIGAQWPLLQSVAWLNMLVTFSAQDGIKTAVVKTFDGKHPCNLCKLVREGKQAEKKNSGKEALKKFDPMMLVTFEIRIEPAAAPLAASPTLFWQLRSYAPLSPPPDLT